MAPRKHNLPIRTLQPSPIRVQALRTAAVSSSKITKPSASSPETLSLTRLRQKLAQNLPLMRKLEDAYFGLQKRILEIDDAEPGGDRDGDGDGDGDGDDGVRDKSEVAAHREWEAELDEAEAEFMGVGGQLRGVEGEVRGLDRRIWKAEKRSGVQVDGKASVLVGGGRGGVRKRGSGALKQSGLRTIIETGDVDISDDVSDVEIVQVKTNVRSMGIAGRLKKTAVVKWE